MIKTSTLVLMALALYSGIPGADTFEKGPWFSIAGKGYFSGKIPLGDIPTLENNSNNHGSIYGDLGLQAGLDSINHIYSDLELWSPEFSRTDSFPVRPSLRLQVGRENPERKRRLNLQFGSLERITVGHGLPVYPVTIPLREFTKNLALLPLRMIPPPRKIWTYLPGLSLV